MTSAKIRIKVGSMELEYEGDPAFLTGGIEALLTTMGDLAGRVPEETSAVDDSNLSAGGSTSPQFKNGAFSFSTNTIAAHMDAKSGPELIICAMAQIELVQGKSQSNRSDILVEMKNAPTYFKETMRSNLSASLNNLVKAKRINQVGRDTYALSAAERKQVEAKVAEIG